MRWITAALGILALSTGAAAKDTLPVHLLLRLSDHAAAQARGVSALPQSVSDLHLNGARLVPVFPHEPRDSKLKANWYRLDLHCWFKLEWTGDPAETVAAQLSRDADLTDIVLSPPLDVLIEPDDFTIHSMWGLTRMSCPAAWDVQQGSSSVIVTTIDTGCRIQHPDLATNMFVNPGEDLNHNGLWDSTDVDGLDQDMNGYTDDIIGWDFVSHSVDSSQMAVGEDYAPADNQIFPDVHGHGTHVMGTAAAVTDNATGVAAASWNVRALPLRAGFAWIGSGGQLNGSGYAEDFAAAIVYATEMGARVISISFGGGYGNPLYPPVINYARDNGTVIFAAAGNSNSASRIYPAAFDSVIAVAATDENDIKATFSSYGTWVDLSAPGVSIWSTLSNNSYHAYDYAAWSGTSMATPNAASVAALLLSYAPALTAQQVENLMKLGCDNIYALNPAYINMLGAGRVNAFRTLGLACSVSPAAPRVVVCPAGDSVRLSWPPVHCASSYLVEFADEPNGGFSALTTTADTTILDSTGVNLERFYQVIAVQ